jgi:thiamine pyrophosphate-dependent acetolactate synthase large subunit-like protein
MRVVDAISEILKREGVEFLACYPTNTLIEAAAAAGIKPVICRQERVGVGIADGFTRVTNGRRIGVFTMQAGPGAENAFSGITTALFRFSAGFVASRRPRSLYVPGAPFFPLGALLRRRHQVD